MPQRGGQGLIREGKAYLKLLTFKGELKGGGGGLNRAFTVSAIIN